MGSSLNHVTILDESAGWLLGKQRNDTSQFGEDGLIQAVLERIGETSRWCFEVGAADGLFFSNTKRLRDAGWSAVLIEAERDLYKQCRQFENAKVHVVNERIGGGSLDAILARCGSPPTPDLGVIDIDGQDYWAWKGMQARPRVMLVEFMYLNENMSDPAFIPTEGGSGQAGLDAIVGLGREKEYTPIASTYCNVLFVDRDAWASN
jgi:hypothetical protein